MPFRHCVSAQDSEFTIPSPATTRDGIKRAYSFNNLTIFPEYVSLTAANHGMDDETVDPMMSEYEYYMEVDYKIGFFPVTTAYALKHTSKKLTDVMKEMNKYFDDNKPPGLTKCPISIDWVHPSFENFLNNPDELKEHLEVFSSVCYSEEDAYKEETHFNVLPESMRSSTPALVNYKLPSVETTLADTRVRLCIAPNTRVSLSNEFLFNLLGFKEKEIGPRGAHSQHHIVNFSSTDTLIVVASGPPTLTFEIEKTKTSKVYIAKERRKLILEGRYQSLKAHETDPDLLLADFANSFAETTKHLEFKIRATKNANSKVQLEFPAYERIDFNLQLSNQLDTLLGFRSPITKTNFVAEKALVKTPVSLTEGFEKGRVLVIDTGGLIVTIENVPSMNTRGHASQFMANLLSDNMGAMVMVPTLRPSVILPLNESHLTFRIYRQNEKNETIRLSWPCNYYVVGTLEGIPI